MRATYTLNSQNITANKSNVTVSVAVFRNDGYAASYYNLYTSANSATIKINGSTKVSANVAVDTRNGKITQMATWTGDVAHNADGTLTLTVATNIACSTQFTGTDSFSWTLTTIPRKSTVSFTHSSINAGTSNTANITSAYSSFTHKLVLTFGSYSDTYTLGAGTNFTAFTVPLSWLNAIPNATSGTVNATLTTYYNGTSLGTSTASFTLKAPASVKPSATISLTRINGNVPSSWNIYLKTASKVQVSVSASGAYSSTIKSYNITCDGYMGTSTPFTTGFLKTAGNVPISVTVTDSRGRTYSTSTSITVVDYVAPKCAATYERSDSDGTYNAVGNYVKIVPTSTVDGIGGRNTHTLKFTLTPSTGSATTKTATSGTAYILPLSGSYTATLSVTVTDAVNNSSTKTYSISTARPVIDIYPDGSGISFQTIAEANKIKFGKPVTLEDLNVLGKITIKGTEVPNGTDLDTLTAPGRYHQDNNNQTHNNINMPIEGLAFTMDVVDIDGMIQQRFYVFNSTSICLRTWYDWTNTWTKWYKFSGVEIP